MGTLCAQLLLPFYADSFETSQVVLSWSEVFFYIILRLILDVNLGILAFNAINVYMYKGGTLCVQLLLQFYIILFETLYVHMSWPEDMNVH